MLNVLMEFRKGILFVRLYGILDDNTIEKFKEEVKEVIVSSGIKYVVLNVENLNSVSSSGIKEIKQLRKILKKSKGEFFLFGGEIKELSKLVNLENELNVFEKSLKDSLDLLKIGGRICVITFHSLEDRMCKEIFNEVSKVDKELNKLPIIPEEFQPKFKIVANISPTKEEIEKNKRARSARLRVIERVK